MRHHYDHWFKAIAQNLEILERKFNADTHAFWLHIDGDKLEKADQLLEQMVTAIYLEEHS